MSLSAIWKSTIREIRQSFGRFMAILAIVALGVGFFAGLKVTKSAMVRTTERYFQKKNLYDFRLLSTIGFEEQEVAFLREQEDIAYVEGAHSYDMIYQEENGSEGVVKIHSITSEINGLQVLEGRLPEKPEECVADANLFKDLEGQSVLGKTIAFSDSNEEEEKEHFTTERFTIVGIVQSPLYIQFERGNTSLGTGKLDGFLYLPPESFAEEYYTEIYVKCRQEFPLYSDAYKDFAEEKEAVWENLTDTAAGNRYRRLLQEGEEKIADARAELEDKKAEGEKELADAEQKLADAEQEIQEGEEKLADAKTEIQDAEKKLADAGKELADARKVLEEKEAELADGEKELADGRKTLQEKEKELENAKLELREAERTLKEQKEKLKESEQQLLLWNQALMEQNVSLWEAQEQLAQQAQELVRLEQAYQGIPLPEPVAAMLAEGWQKIAEAQKQLEEGRAAMEESKKEYAVQLAALEAGKKQLREAENTLKEGKEQVQSGTAAIQEGWEELNEAQKELEEGRAEIEKAKKTVTENEEKLETEKKKLSDAEEDVLSGEEDIAEGKRKYEEGLSDYQEAKQEFEEKVADAEEELADAEEKLAELEEPETYVLGRNTNIGYLCFESDSCIVDGIANVFPVFFFLVAALVCITTMNRMVEEQRTQIGVLKALGYGEGLIMFKYIFYAGLAAVLGCVIGFFGGTWMFPSVIWTAYGMMYRVDTIGYVFDGKLALVSFIVSLICSVGTTCLSCRVELTSVAAQLMRPRAPKAGKRVFLEYLPFLWKRLGFLRKVSVRNIMRYKKRLFMMVLGIGGCTALLVTGFGIKDSIAGVADQQFSEIQIYDAAVTYSDEITQEMTAERKEECGEMLSGEFAVWETSGDLLFGGQLKTANIVVFDDTPKRKEFLDLHTMQKETIENPKMGEAVLSHKLAEYLGASEGEEIVLRIPDKKDITLRISAVQQNFIYNYLFVSSETYTALSGEEPPKKTVYLKLAQGKDVHQLSAALMKLEKVSNVTVNEDTLVRFNTMMKSLDLIVVVVILCAAGLAFIVLYNLTNINILERIREIATIKVLGFYKNETAMYVFRENLVLTALGALAGLPLGKGLHLFVMSQINVDMITFDVRIRTVSYLYSILLTFLFTCGINLLMGAKLEKISMTESLKSVD